MRPMLSVAYKDKYRLWADVFRGGNEHAARDEPGVFARVNHLRQPVERGVGIAAAHGFDERRDGVVVGVTIAVVHDGVLLNALLRHRQRDVNETIVAVGGGERGDFERVQGFARVAVGHAGEMDERVVVRLNLQVAEAVPGIRDGATEQNEQIILVEWLQCQSLSVSDERNCL